jgi:protein-tyrosine phosphatase
MLARVIDLHCHVLPGIDDGAADLEDSAGMARQADADGIELICATPHIRHDHDVRIHELAWRVEELNGELGRRGLKARVIPGGEVAETIVERLDDGELRLVSLGAGGGWVLLEPAPGPLSDSLDRATRLLAARGYRSVIAHPERHLARDLPERLERLIRAGALVQATAAALVDEATAPFMLELAGRGLVHVLGSDAHSSHFGRPVRLSDAVDRLRLVRPDPRELDWMAVSAPAGLIAGEDVHPPFEPASG